MVKDYVGGEWFDILPHVIDDLEQGAFEMGKHTSAYVRLFTGMHRAEKQYRNPLQVGDTVRITCDVCQGLIGELKTIDPEEPDENFFGIQLDTIEGWIFFRADEIERVDLAELPF